MCFYEVAWDRVIQKLSSQDVVHQSFTSNFYSSVIHLFQLSDSHKLLTKKGNARETEIETEMCWREELLPVFSAGENTSIDTVKCPLTPDLHSNCSEFCSFRTVHYPKANHECLSNSSSHPELNLNSVRKN